MTHRKVSRREFLEATAVTSAAAAAAMFSNVRKALALSEPPGFYPDPNPDHEGNPAAIDWFSETLSFNEVYGNPPVMGRVHFGNRLSIFQEPHPKSNRVRNVYGGYVAPIYRAVQGERYDTRGWSPIWYETKDGYLHSSFFIPCHEIYHQPEEVIGTGFWGEVTVPYSWQHRRPDFASYRYDYDYYKLFWSQVHRVVERADDAQGNAWYRVLDDIEPERQAWVQAKHIRRITPEELAPISPDVSDKRIVIDLGAQRLTCYEFGIPVFQTYIASGTKYANDAGEVFDFSTPEGVYHVQRKRPSRRMRGGDAYDLGYDINGVPWCTYFTFSGAAVHGAYWHNNFGFPRSHGCINVTADAAKWVYRWSQPTMGYDEDYRWVQDGEDATPIEITL